MELSDLIGKTVASVHFEILRFTDGTSVYADHEGELVPLSAQETDKEIAFRTVGEANSKVASKPNASDEELRFRESYLTAFWSGEGSEDAVCALSSRIPVSIST